MGIDGSCHQCARSSTISLTHSSDKVESRDSACTLACYLLSFARDMIIKKGHHRGYVTAAEQVRNNNEAHTKPTQ